MAATRLPGYFLVVCFLANLAVQARAKDVRWNVTNVEKKQGEKFSVKCTIENMGRLEVVRLVKKDEAEDHVTTIADLNDLKTPFKETRRYDVKFEMSKDRRASIILSYIGIRGEDAGRIGCNKRGSQDTVWVDIKVLVPVKDMYIARKVSEEPEIHVQDGDMVVLREEKDDGVICVATVNGSMIPPTLTVTVGGEDRTADFTPMQDSRTLPNGGLPYHFAESKLAYINLNPDASFNGKELKCTAENKVKDKVVSAMLAVEYIPIVTCNKYEHYGIIGESITLSCAVQFNPRGEISWSWGESEQVIKSGDLDEANHLEATEESMDRTDKVKANLKISEITKEHLGTLTLTAKNEYGTKFATLSLREGSAKPEPKPVPEVESKNEQESKDSPKPEEVSGNEASRPWSTTCLVLILSVAALLHPVLTRR